MARDKAAAVAGRRQPYAAPAVDYALDIVEYLAQNHRAYGINELARQLGISTNMVFRVLRRLTARGYAEQEPAGGYRLGVAFFGLGMRLYQRFDLRLRARPYLERLCAETHQTCQIHIPDRDRALVLDCVCPTADFFLQITPGSRLYYHANAFGKAILAFLPRPEAEALLPRRLPRLTAATIVTHRRLLEELARTQCTGIAYDREEYCAGIFCIGAPVFNVVGRAVAGAGITGIFRRDVAAYFSKWEEAVLKCCQAISADIGYTGSHYDDFARQRQRVGAGDACQPE